VNNSREQKDNIMKVIKTGNEIKVDMSFDEWVRTGSSRGWIKKVSSTEHDKLAARASYSAKIKGMLKTAASGDVHDISSLPHLVLLNSGSDSPRFAEDLVEAMGKNKSMPKPRFLQLDVSKASKRDPETLKKSIASVITASNTVWKVISSSAPSMDIIKAFADNSGPMHKSNTWVVFETSD
jgi:hypothetical protein